MAKAKKTEEKGFPDLWTYYRVTWEFMTRVCGSTPADPEVIKKWLEAREPRVKPAGALSIQEINEEVLASIERGEGEPDQSYSLLVFQRYDGHVVQRYSTVKAHLKDCGRVISQLYTGKIEGEKSFAVRVLNGVYLDENEYWLSLRRPDGSFIMQADGEQDKAIHVRGPRGQQLNALKRFEYVLPPCVLTFTLKVLGKSVSEVDLHHLFTYGGTHGYAGERSDGEGRYRYHFERIDHLETARESATTANR